MSVSEKNGKKAAEPSGAAKKLDLLKVGQSCLLNVMGRHFLVRILEIARDTIRISFPGRDYPIDAMRANLEFHDDDGFFYYVTEVVRGPREDGDGVVLRKPTELKRNLHRQCCRVTTDLTVQVKDQVHVRRYTADLVDISVGGALIRTDAPFDFSTTVELSLSLPGEPSFVVTGQVIHVANAQTTGTAEMQLFGTRFTDLDDDTVRGISRYIWERLQDLYSRR